ncbi:HAD family hydrolase [Desulfuromonas sp. AOP6]|uniref:HAD family hydrolase n=1 Tax=Desulfuromonas sp. AOP6 TaxID=1566351 RepID=UPI00126A8A32|nr:HAD family hydrolase [Desulfuromonas sp. AOP6]BCA79191.1 haloacid dehalogenase [Desulfuromonas sp. AOP6]
MLRAAKIKAIIFDLDGTLYTSKGMEREIAAAAESLVAQTRGMTPAQGRNLLRSAKKRLAESLEEEPTLTRTCLELGIDIPDLHRAFQQQVHPERYLENDPILFALLDSLRDHCDLYIYTNNNLPLAQKILALLGVEELFSRLYTIEFCGMPKPDANALQKVVADIGGTPDSFLFVGDRQAVDLKAPRALGSSVLLVRDTSDLLQIHKTLGIIP